MSTDLVPVKYNWPAIELDYRAGIIPLPGICHKYGVSYSRLNRVASEQGWHRIELTPEEIFSAAVFTQNEGMTDDEDPDWNAIERNQPNTYLKDVAALDPEAIRRLAQAQAVQILQSHRKDVRKLRALLELLSDRAIAALAGAPQMIVIENPKFFVPGFENDPDYEKQHIMVTAPWIGGRESPADLITKLTSTLVRLIGLERQSFGFDVLLDPEGNPNSATIDGQVGDSVSDIDKLRERIEQIARKKVDDAQKDT